MLTKSCAGKTLFTHHEGRRERFCNRAEVVIVAEEESVLGTWYLKEAVMEGLTLQASDLGMSVTMEFGEDGTLVVTICSFGPAIYK